MPDENPLVAAARLRHPASYRSTVAASTSIVIVTRSGTSSASTPESSLAMTVRPGSGIGRPSCR
jgi:hypothetical protein